MADSIIRDCAKIIIRTEILATANDLYRISDALFLKSSVTRLGYLFDFGQLFKAFDNNLFAQISYILRQFL